MDIRKKSFIFFKIACYYLLQYFLIVGIIGFNAIGCGCRDSDNPPPVPEVYEGVFLDSAVKGLTYKTGSQTGITDSDGTFKYQDEETITFSIGDVILGQTIAKEIIIPLDLVDGATDEKNPIVSNICQLLQSLDVDGNLDNGITINEATISELEGKSIDFTLDITDFENNLVVQNLFDTLNERGIFTDGIRTLIPASQAQNHLKETLNNIDNDGDGVTENQGDCDDTDADLYPKATEICDDGKDNDCDGYIDCNDSDCSSVCKTCSDVDVDGYYAESGCGTEVDCDDADAGIYPGATEICGDEIDQDCNGNDLSCPPDPDDVDNDGDGVTENQGDCDDADAGIYP
ncbi:MAG: MopE-related protein, partial [bacterium]